MLRRMFGSEGNEVMKHIKNLHKEGRHNFYVSPNVIRAMKSKWNEVCGHVGMIGEKVIAHGVNLRMCAEFLCVTRGTTGRLYKPVNPVGVGGWG
jgi:hypothetical protein